MNKQFSQPDEQGPGNNQSKNENFQESTHIHHHEFSTSEGSEYLDDAIRMEYLQQGDTDTAVIDEIALYVSEPFNEPGGE